MQIETYHIITFGCQMNVRDSNWISARFASMGLKEESLENANIIVINTCSVREKPERKVGNLIRRIEWLTREKSDVVIGVLGCVAQQLGCKLYEYGGKVRLLAGTDGICHVPDAMVELLANRDEKREYLDFESIYPEREYVKESWPAGEAYVNIMQGCDNFCSYCIVPFTRGRQHSRKEADIISECRMHVENGAREITLLGQNVNAWGHDSHGGKFSDLLHKVAAIDGLKRLRFVTPHPKDMDENTINAFGELSCLCPRLHLPLQSGSDYVLSRMRRRYGRADFLRLVEKLRNTVPDIALSTDLIVGFPGEREVDFQATLETMRACEFMSSFSFCYSDRPGTRASLMPEKIDKSVMAERLIRLQELQDQLSQGWLNSRLGDETDILLEMPSAKNSSCDWQGRDPYGMVVNVKLLAGKPGEIVKVRIKESKKHSLVGQTL